MPSIIIAGDVYTCPLCFDKFQVMPPFPPKGEFWLVCHKDKICVKKNDPCIGKWNDRSLLLEETEEDPHCPVCHREMRFFFRSDGYMKAKCPNKKCGATIETGDVKEDFKDAPKKKKK